MQIRILGGCKRLLMAAAIASLIAAPTRRGDGRPGARAQSPDRIGGPQVSTPEDEPRVGSAILFPRSNYVWPFASGPGLRATSSPSKWSDAGVLHTPRRIVRPHARPAELCRRSCGEPNKLGASGSQYFLLQVKPEAVHGRRRSTR